MTYNTSFFELTDNGDFIKIKVIGHSYPGAELNHDKNWLNTTINVKAGAFSGSFKAEMQTFDFEIFKKELEVAYDHLGRSAIFEGLESQVKIHILGDGIGHFIAKCNLMDHTGIGNELKCEFNLDQTQLPIIIDQLNNIITIFQPIRD